jgi:hypothetical protein
MQNEVLAIAGAMSCNQDHHLTKIIIALIIWRAPF